MKAFILKLEEATDIGVAGGKASSLARLINGGFRTANGFVITTVAGMQITPKLEQNILQEFDKLETKQVAVRSSAVGEDSKDAAWAGQFDTFLNTDRQHLIQKIKKCWLSATSTRARAYAKEKNLKAGKVAVIVQAMINSDVAGVAFSAHPVTQNRKLMVIEAVHGLGEKLVSGLTTPDTYIVDKENSSAIEPFLQAKKPVLKNSEIAAIAQQVIEIEKLFGRPMDVEWAIANCKLYILQSRPITTL